MKYAVIVEEDESSFGAHVPDLPGCVAVADTKADVLKLIPEAIQFHIEGLREDGLLQLEPLICRRGNLMVPFLKKSLSIFLPLTRSGVLTSLLRGYSYSERRGSFMSDVKSSSSFRHSTGFTMCSSKPASREHSRSDSSLV